MERFIILQVDKKISKLIGDHSIMDHAGSNVTLSISSTCLTLKLRDTHAVISTHDMPRISFASGGDAVRIIKLFFKLNNLILVTIILGHNRLCCICS